jgi:hypothetical protein
VLLRIILLDLVDCRGDEADDSETTGPGTDRLMQRAIVLREFSIVSEGGLDQALRDTFADGISARMKIANRLW